MEHGKLTPENEYNHQSKSSNQGTKGMATSPWILLTAPIQPSKRQSDTSSKKHNPQIIEMLEDLNLCNPGV